jgi:hypothetical protein
MEMYSNGSVINTARMILLIEVILLQKKKIRVDTVQEDRHKAL